MKFYPNSTIYGLNILLLISSRGVSIDGKISIPNSDFSCTKAKKAIKVNITMKIVFAVFSTIARRESILSC